MDIALDMQQRMFQFADFDNSGSIEQGEFKVAWDYLKEKVSDMLIRRLGLDDGAVFAVVCSVLAFFAVCIPLFLLMVGLWSNQSSFVNVIHSFFFSAVGLFANRKKVDENDDGGKKVGAQVDKVMKGLGESASDNIK